MNMTPTTSPNPNWRNRLVRLQRLSRFAIGMLAACVVPFASAATPPNGGHVLSIEGSRFLMDGAPFPYTGVSFFNAIYNPTFNENSASRLAWIGKFQRYGINVLRVWIQWDNDNGFVDSGTDKTLFDRDGNLHAAHLATLKAILADADTLGVVIQLVIFSRESWLEDIRLTPAGQDRALSDLTRELRPYRNLIFQIWNEFDDRVLDHLATIKAIDPLRIVTNSPGIAGNLGDPKQNAALDYLTPHTIRQGGSRRVWEVAPTEIAYLLKRFNKPVVDDEPARNGTAKFGGPRGGATSPFDHIIQIQKMWEMGAYVCYHHDMFQTGYHTASVPPSGIPDPEFSPYHHEVFKFLALRDRYMHRATTPTPLP